MNPMHPDGAAARWKRVSRHRFAALSALVLALSLAVNRLDADAEAVDQAVPPASAAPETASLNPPLPSAPSHAEAEGMLFKFEVPSLEAKSLASTHQAAKPEAPEAPAQAPAGTPARNVQPPGAPGATNALNPLENEALHNPNLVVKKPVLEKKENPRRFELRLAVARRLRLESKESEAETNLVALMESEAPVEVKKAALLELALLAQQQNQLARAVQIYGQFLQRFPQDPNVPEVQLRQGLLYRKMGSTSLALNKFYGVMSSALSLKLDHWERYQRLVLQAKTEIADTCFLDGKYDEAVDLFLRLLKEEAPELNRSYIHYKLIRAYACRDKHGLACSQAEVFLSRYPEAGEAPEVRYLYASALKKQGRNSEALKQVMALLEAQSRSAAQSPQNWAFWQQRTGNEIANQLYQEGDYANALTIYQFLAKLDNAPTWQMPVLYQVGLVFERLSQPEKAIESYQRILAQEPSLTNAAPPSLRAVMDMAKWRKQYLSWQTGAEKAGRELQAGALPIRNRSMAP